MIDAFALVDKLSTFTLGGLVALILLTSYFKLWRWGSDFEDMKADYERRLAKQEQLTEKQEKSTELWQTAALSVTSIAEVIAKKRAS